MIMRLEALEREPLTSRFVRMLRRGWARILAAQEARAKSIARRHLATRSDATLRDLGFSPEEIRQIRQCRETADPLWYSL
jgi:uncharacterized protein YjiS (DUF1127 family)